MDASASVLRSAAEQAVSETLEFIRFVETSGVITRDIHIACMTPGIGEVIARGYTDMLKSEIQERAELKARISLREGMSVTRVIELNHLNEYERNLKPRVHPGGIVVLHSRGAISIGVAGASGGGGKNEFIAGMVGANFLKAMNAIGAEDLVAA